MPHYLNPKSDLIFTKIFGKNPDLLKSFLNAVLPLPEDCIIESLTYLPRGSAPEIPGFQSDKISGFQYSMIDVRCEDQHERHFIVEIQLQWIDCFIKQMLFKNTKAPYIRLEKKETSLSPVYGLTLSDTNFSKENQWFHQYRMTSSQGQL